MATPGSAVGRERPNEWLERATEVAEIARAHAIESEQQRRLASPVVDALIASELLTVTLPAAYGGAAIDLPQLVEVLKVLGHADGAAGWCTMIGVTTTSLAAFAHPDAVSTVFPDRRVATAGVFAPNGVATADADGWIVNGRWAWGSGTQHASWIVGGVRSSDDQHRVCWFPRSAVQTLDNWHTVGLRGTGSVDFSVVDAHVADEFTILVGRRPVVEGPLARFPNFTMLAIGVASVSLGIARRAIDEIVDLADGKVPQFSSRTLAHSPFAQTEIARAEARWRAADAFVRDAVARAWSIAASGDPVEIADRVALRLAAAQAANECVAVANTAWTVAGGTAVSDSGAVGRCMRDTHMVTQHIMVAPKVFETLGRYYAGVEFHHTMI